MLSQQYFLDFGLVVEREVGEPRCHDIGAGPGVIGLFFDQVYIAPQLRLGDDVGIVQQRFEGKTQTSELEPVPRGVIIAVGIFLSLSNYDVDAR